MVKLYCVCNVANQINCDKCEKYKRIKPDQTLKWPAWKRVVRKKNNTTIKS